MPSHHSSSHVYRTRDRYDDRYDDRSDHEVVRERDEYVVVERPGRSDSRIRYRHPSPPNHIPAASQSISTATNPRSSNSYHRDPVPVTVHCDSRELHFARRKDGDAGQEVEVVRETTREERDSARERESALELAKDTGKEVQLVRSVRHDSDDEHKDETFYTRDDGVLVVRSAPDEIEIVEQVVPVSVRSDRSRRKSLDMRGAENPAPYKRLIVACDGELLFSTEFVLPCC